MLNGVIDDTRPTHNPLIAPGNRVFHLTNAFTEMVIKLNIVTFKNIAFE